MNTLTRDFSGEYDWPAEEAHSSASYIKEFESEYTREELHDQIEKEHNHWAKVFGNDEQGVADMTRFVEVFNQEIKPLNFLMLL